MLFMSIKSCELMAKPELLKNKIEPAKHGMVKIQYCTIRYAENHKKQGSSYSFTSAKWFALTWNINFSRMNRIMLTQLENI